MKLLILETPAIPRSKRLKLICNYFGIAYKARGVEVPSTAEKVFYQVVAGSFSVKENAEKRVQELKEAGFGSFIQVKK